MFVAEGARETLLVGRKEKFKEEFVKPMINEMLLLGLTEKELSELIERVKEDEYGQRRI